jgi:hypothetical protein
MTQFRPRRPPRVSFTDAARIWLALAAVFFIVWLAIALLTLGR